MGKRSKRSDGLKKRFRSFVLQNFAPVWRLLERIPGLSQRINGYIINTACNAAAYRPHPLATEDDYTSWRSLTDKRFLARSIAPDTSNRERPPAKEVAALFKPYENGQRECPKSTLLFPIFAQYLTDGFLRTVKEDPRTTTSNHDIDLSPLYGRTKSQTDTLRLRSNEEGQKGRLKSRKVGGEEFPLALYQDGASDLDRQFTDKDGQSLLDPPLGMDAKWAPGEHSKRCLFAVGGDRANSSALISMMNTLWLREHNRLAGELERQNPGWDDSRVFETSRNIVIAMFIKIVVEEYINHISSACFRLRADPKVAWKAPWNRPNWMTVEFSLLYRWHSLVPETMLWRGSQTPVAGLLLDNSKLLEAGLANAFRWAGQTRATKLDLHNTAAFLDDGSTNEEYSLNVEYLAIKQDRDRNLAGYNAYRKSMGFKPVDGFDCMTANEALRDELANLYGSPDAVEFYVGLFAEDNGPNTPMPPLLGSMVALDAFSQALNNPLLSQQVFHAGTFTEFGMGEIERTTKLADLLSRNAAGGATETDAFADVRMTRPDWKRSWIGL